LVKKTGFRAGLSLEVGGTVRSVSPSIFNHRSLKRNAVLKRNAAMNNKEIDDTEYKIVELFKNCHEMVDIACAFTDNIEINGPVRTLIPNDREKLNTSEKGLLDGWLKLHKDFTQSINTVANLFPEKTCKRFREITELCEHNALIYKSRISGMNEPDGGWVAPKEIRDKFTELTAEIRESLNERVNAMGEQGKRIHNERVFCICKEILSTCREMKDAACNFSDNADFSPIGVEFTGHTLDIPEPDKRLFEKLSISCGVFTQAMNRSACFIANDICNRFYEMRNYCAHNLFLYADSKGFIIFPLWNNEEYELDNDKWPKKTADDIRKKFNALEDDINKYIEELDR
jgi:hypothetical protein